MSMQDVSAKSFRVVFGRVFNRNVDCDLVRNDPYLFTRENSTKHRDP